MTLLIVGSSARAAVHSALRAGLEGAAIDRFADQDILTTCWTRHWRNEDPDSPEVLESLFAEAPPGPWLYTGPLENHPALIDRLAARRTLWGLTGPSLRAVRDPFTVRDELVKAGIPAPGLRPADSPPLRRDGSWLLKPLHSSGGTGIKPFASNTTTPVSPHYFQEFIPGAPLSAIFIRDQSGRPATLLGCTLQLLGCPGHPFAYTGSVGPFPLEEASESRVRVLGETLGAAFELRGLFGVDLILRDSIPWPIEVNPRYTASVEILELATGVSLLAAHAQAFFPDIPALIQRRQPVDRTRTARPHPQVVGKLVLFAERDLIVPSQFLLAPRPRDPWRIPALADIPAPGGRLRAGEPVCTVLARGPSLQDCVHRLKKRSSIWWISLNKSADFSYLL